jgi:hypothetical protein
LSDIYAATPAGNARARSRTAPRRQEKGRFQPELRAIGGSTFVHNPSHLSDERWELIRPVIEAWKAVHPSVSGHRGRYEKILEIVNAILYQTPVVFLGG